MLMTTQQDLATANSITPMPASQAPRSTQGPRIPEGVNEEVRFRPELITWWGMVARWSRELHACHRWLASDHPISTSCESDLERHCIPTLVLCLAGSTRVESAHGHLDLAAGEALAIAPGAWHRHTPLRPGSVVYRQGFILGRSDFFLMDSRLHLIATVPENPSRRLMEQILLNPNPTQRVAATSYLLATVVGEEARPRPLKHPSVLAMIYALQNTLHQHHGVEAAVRASGLSRAQAYRAFKEDTGMGLATMRRKLRQELASWLRQEQREAC